MYVRRRLRRAHRIDAAKLCPPSPGFAHPVLQTLIRRNGIVGLRAVGPFGGHTPGVSLERFVANGVSPRMMSRMLRLCGDETIESNSSETRVSPLLETGDIGDVCLDEADSTPELTTPLMRRQASVFSTTCNILSVTFGAIQIPYTFGQMGWTLGSLGLLLSSASTWVSARYIGHMCLQYPREATSYPAVGGLAFGNHGAVFVAAMQWLSYFLTGAVQIGYSGASYQQTMRGTRFARSLCTEGWMLVTTLLMAPACFVRSFTDATFLSVAVVASQLFGLAVFAAQIADRGTYKAADLPCYSQFTSSSALAALSSIAYAFGGHGVLPELAREMRQPTSYYLAIDVSGFGFDVLCQRVANDHAGGLRSGGPIVRLDWHDRFLGFWQRCLCQFF